MVPFARAARLMMVVGVALTVTLLSPEAGHASIPRSPAPTCGGTTVYKSDGSAWTCTFDDEFNGTSLDTTKWTAWDKVDYFESSVCYDSDPRHVSVGGGYLKLTVTRLTTPQQCATPLGTVSDNFASGLVHTSGHFSQTYGRWEARIKFAGTDGLHDDFWLYPTGSLYPGQAEIDIAEPYGGWANAMWSATHMTGPTGTDDGGVGWCTLNNWASGFHTYTLVWTATAISFSYDGTQCYSYTNWTPMTGFAAPAPFNQPFFTILQTTLDGTDASTVLPATTEVDYVRVWK